MQKPLSALSSCGLALLLLASSLCVVAVPAAAAPPPAAEETDAADPLEPLPPHERKPGDYIEVRAPYAPTSNTVATKMPVPLHLTPWNVGVVSRLLIEEQAATVLGDALTNVSGLNVQGGQGVTDYFLIRGFNSLDGALLLVDGAVEPEASYYGMYNVEGIEVLKGPGGFLYGRNPVAGVVNLIRKQPRPGNFGIFRGSAGSFDTYEGNLDWNLSSPDGRRSFRLNGLWWETEGYRDGQDGQRLGVNPSFRMQLGDATTLNFNVEYLDFEASPDSGIPLLANAIPDVPRRRSYASPFDSSEQEIARFQVDLESRLSQRVTLRNKTFLRDLDWQSAGTLILATVAFPPEFGGTQVLRNLTQLDDRQTFWGNQFELVFRAGTGAVEHTLLAGVEVNRIEDDFSLLVGDLPPIALFNPVETATSVATFPFLVGDERTDILAPYVIDRIEFSDRVQLMLGARYDEIDVDVDFATNFQEAVDGYRRDDSELSPLLGLTVSPNDRTALYANAGRSFAPVGARVFNAGELRPERSEQIEAGVRRRFLDGKLRATLAGYRIERDNIPISDANGVTQQAGDQRSEGVEFELAAEPLPGLRTFLAYAYNDTRLTRFSERVITGPNPGDFIVLDRTGNRAPFAPENIASLWIGKTFGQRLDVAGGARWVDRQYIDEDNAFAIDSYATVDAMLAYGFDTWRLRINALNLTDEEYQRRGFGSTSVIPAEPFSVRAAVEWRFP